MEIIKDYKKYQEFEPEYQKWKNEVDKNALRRKEYIKNNSITADKVDLARTKALLNAIDTMDEFSQSNAEEMEVATETAQAEIAQLASFAGMGLGALAIVLPSVRSFLEKISKTHPKLAPVMLLLPSMAGMVFSMIATIPLISWSAKKQVGASRRGRFEAMRTDLSNPVHFAVLTDEQEKKAHEVADAIPVDKEIKKSLKKNMGRDFDMGGVFKQLKTLFKKDDEYEKQKKEFDEKLNKNASRYKETLSEQDILNAKKDAQLMAQVVEKMDYASQEYAEKVELATNSMSAFAMFDGLFSTWLSSKIISLFKFKNKYVNGGIPAVIGFGVMISLSSICAKLQKQASRVGRYQVKKEFLNNPETLLYIDESKLSKDEIELPKAKKENIFKFLARIYKENREYNAYIKEAGIKNKQYHKALESIELTEKQLKDAKTLQMNTFKTFNKVDEKSQKYAESVEAVGELIKLPVSLVGSLLGLGLGFLLAKKDFKAYETMTQSATSEITALVKTYSKFLLGLFTGIAPTIALDTVFTKKQIQASKVADMLALKELSDYKNYVDYDNLTSPAPDNAPKTVAGCNSELLESWIKKQNK